MQQGLQPNDIFQCVNGILHRYLSFKLKPGNIASSVEAIQKKWATLLPGSPLNIFLWMIRIEENVCQ